jgi:hypothetical protein
MAQFSEKVLQVIIFFLIQVILNLEYILGNLIEYYIPMKKGLSICESPFGLNKC